MGISVVTPALRSGLLRWLKDCQGRLRALWRTNHKRPSLSIKETAGLGERRFVAVVQFERQRFLIGGSAGSVTLLSELPREETDERP
jgi:flagellar biogenesis protein FliO